jgi:phage terminase large subunit-like protein
LGSLKNGVNVYDFAGTPFKDDLIPGLRIERDREARTQGDADWSARMRLWRATDGTYVIDRIQRYRDTPGAVRQWLLRNATEDGPAVVTAVWQDPGQAGVDQIEQLQKEMIKIRRRLHCIGAPAHSKEAYARLPSRLAFAGRIILHPCLKEDRVAARFLDAWFNESEQFPEGEHDDMVDCLSLGILYLENFAGVIGPPLQDPTARFARAGAEFMMSRAAIAASRQALRPRRRMAPL